MKKIKAIFEAIFTSDILLLWSYWLIKFYWWFFTGKSTNFSIINENSESEPKGEGS